MGQPVSVKRSRTRPAVQTADETVFVHSSIAGEESEERQVIEVHRFATEPAYARVAKGITANMGNYESLRIDVGVTLPCYAEEIEEALDVAADKAHAFLAAECKRHKVEF